MSNGWEKIQQEKFHNSGRDAYKNDKTFERIVESEYDVDTLYLLCGCVETRNGYGLLLDSVECKKHGGA